MGVFAKQIGALIAGQMAGSNQRAKFIVKTLRAGYTVSIVGVGIVWYSAYRNERVAPGDVKFPFPLVNNLKRQFAADRPEKELDHAAPSAEASGPNHAKEPGQSSFNGFSDGHKLQAKHQELKPGIARVVETIQQHFPQLIITATTNGTHAAHSYHYLGRAVDLAGPKQVMESAAKWIEQNMIHILTEGIHNPGLSVKDKQAVPSSFWGSETWAAHTDHIHVAV